MATNASDAELRRRLLRLIMEDEEFRLAVAGAIGLREILEELRWLRRKSLEHDKRFEVIERKLLEHDKRFEAIERKLLEHDKRFEAIEKKLLEHDRRFEAIERKLLEHDKRFEVIEKKLLEHDKRFDELNKRIDSVEAKLYEHDQRLNEINKRLSNVELIVGAMAESMYSRFVLDDLREDIRGRGERIVERRRNARINDEDIDLLIVTDKSVYVVEVKVKPRVADVGALLAKAEIVAKKYPGLKVVPVLAGAMIGSEVLGYAKGKNVEVYIY